MSKKILYISDSLGTPIHPRGIYYYSVALVEVLNELGADVTLLVEKTKEFGMPDFMKTRASEGAEAYNTSMSSEIFRYFAQREFSSSLQLRKDSDPSDLIEVTIKKGGNFDSAYTEESEDFLIDKYNNIGRKRNFLHVKNSHKGQSVFQKRGKHLSLFSGFVWGDYIYSDSMSYAVNDLPPPQVDAAGYDFVFIDTPHYVSVTGIGNDKIFSVVHDLIPVRDFSMNAEWRILFVQKLKATLEHDPNMIFVSKFTRDQFQSELPDFYKPDSLLIHPTIKNEDIRKISAIQSVTASSMSNDSSRNVAVPKKGGIFNILGNIKNRSRMDVAQKGNKTSAGGQGLKFAHLDARLPFFCTALSDEPRKNVGVIVEASKRFVGKANFIVMGQINRERYIGNNPESFSNLHFTGYVSDEYKSDIFRHALGVIFPSFAEGFGIPLVEGALYKKPVICSDIAVFREIAGDDALYFDPYSADSLQDAIKKLMAKPEEYRKKAENLYPTLIARFSQDAMRRVLAERL